jgi:hypothetical protein
MDGISLFGPLVLTTNLVFLLRSEVILDVEGFADLLRRLALDHIGDGLATNVEKSLDIKIVGGLEMVVSKSLWYPSPV